MTDKELDELAEKEYPLRENADDFSYPGGALNSFQRIAFKAGYAASAKRLKVIEQDDTPPMDKTLLMDIPEPIGNFIIEQKDITGTMGNDGMYYHYSQVCILLNRLKSSLPQSSTEEEKDKLISFARWMDSEEHPNRIKDWDYYYNEYIKYKR